MRLSAARLFDFNLSMSILPVAAVGLFLWALFFGLILIGAGRVLVLPLFKRDLLRHERRRLARETRLYAWTLISLSALM